MDPKPRSLPNRGGFRVFDTLTVLGFLAVLAAPALDLRLRSDDARSPVRNELRTPAPRPELPLSLEAATVWPKSYEEHFRDTFGLRDRLLRWNSIVKVFGFGVSPAARLYFGRDGWVFFDDQLSKENHRGDHPFTAAELDKWARVLEQKRARLAELGVRYLYVVAPDKESVYPELLPGYMRPIGPTRLEQLARHLEERAPEVEFLDLRAALAAAKRDDAPDEFVYTKLGTHWSGRGAWVALRAIVSRMDELAGGFAPADLEHFVRVPIEENGDSSATRMYIADLLPSRLHAYVPPEPKATAHLEKSIRAGRILKSEIPASQLPRAILMHDSFGAYVDKGLAEQCSYLECRWDFSLPIDELAAASPAILVDLYVERSLNTLDPHLLLPAEPEPWAERFQASKRTLLAADRGKPTWGLRGVGGAVLGLATDTPRARIPLTVAGIEQLFACGRLAPVAGEVPVLHLSIDSPASTMFVLWHKPPELAELVRRFCYSRPLSPGANELYVPLDRPGTEGDLLLRPGVQAGSYLLRELEIRSVVR